MQRAAHPLVEELNVIQLVALAAVAVELGGVVGEAATQQVQRAAHPLVEELKMVSSVVGEAATQHAQRAAHPAVEELKHDVRCLPDGHASLAFPL